MRFETLDMRYSIIIPKRPFTFFLAFSFLLAAFNGCKKADRFYDKLTNLPQIDYSQNYVYKPAYVVGDTMVIYGRLQPQNNLQITIGSTTAQIVNTTQVDKNVPGEGDVG